MQKVKFTQMKDGDKEDYELLAKFEEKFVKGTAERVIKVLKSLNSSLGGYQVSDQIMNEIDISSYIALVRSACLACGIMFELPIIIFFLSTTPTQKPAKS